MRHPLHGEGVVESWRRGGRAAVVRFEGRPLPVEVPRRELEDVGEAAEPADSAPEPETGYGGSIEHERALLTLEAMRLGVVPAADLGAYTVGRDGELDLAEGDLERVASGQGAARAFLGDYGTGKTHLLELIQQRALDRGYLTALVMLDPEETAPSHPKRVYRDVVRSLRYPDRPYEEGVGLEPLLSRAVDTPEAMEAFLADQRVDARRLRGRLDETSYHLYLTPALACWRALSQPDAPRRLAGMTDDEAETWLEATRALLADWLEGHPTLSNQDLDSRMRRLRAGTPKLYSLLDYRPWARIYGYLLSGLSALARAVGYQGLVVLLDEAEFYTLLSRENRGFARDLFKAWTVSAVGGGAEGDDPSGIVDDGAGTGGHGIQRELPARYPGDAGLGLQLAMTPHDEGVEVLREAVPESATHELARLSGQDYVTLAERVCDFYASAHPDWRLPQFVVPALGRIVTHLVHADVLTNPRQAMKFVIEFLDVARHEPNRVSSVVRNLQETLAF